MENPNDTFDFKDFILSILRRWRLFLLCLLLFAFVGAGLRAFSFVRNSSEPDGKKSPVSYTHLTLPTNSRV